MAWIESHQSLKDHRKTKEFKRMLGIKLPQAIGHLHLLWWWALDNAPDGYLTGINFTDIAEVAEWPGKPERFIEALKAAGFLDDDLYLHDWETYAGKLISRRKANTERVRQHRNALRNANVTVTSPLRNGATVPNSTVPNSTSVSDKSANNSKINTEISLPKLSNHPFIAQMQEYLGYPAIVDKDPVPNPAKEGNFIKKMQSRGFSDEDIMSLWRAKVKAKNNNFVSMQWVNEDIGKSNHNNKPHNKMIIKQDLSGSVCRIKEDYEKIMALRKEEFNQGSP